MCLPRSARGWHGRLVVDGWRMGGDLFLHSLSYSKHDAVVLCSGEAGGGKHARHVVFGIVRNATWYVTCTGRCGTGDVQRVM